MLLLVVDKDQNLKKKKENYLKNLDIKKIIAAHSLDEAKEIIKNRKISDTYSLVINFVVIEQFLKEHKDISELSDIFNGVIILRVTQEDELKALELLKAGVITEYFLADKDEKIESEHLKKAFNISLQKKNFNRLTRRFEEDLNKIKAVRPSKLL